MLATVLSLVALTATCPATRSDTLGPFYVPNAPVRSSVGTGYVLSGVVRSKRGCVPLARARIELWLAGPAGEYGPRWRATAFSNRFGRYRFSSHFPPPYSGRPSHIHIRVTARGHRTLVTQHYPRAGNKRGTFNLNLRPR